MNICICIYIYTYGWGVLEEEGVAARKLARREKVGRPPCKERGRATTGYEPRVCVSKTLTSVPQMPPSVSKTLPRMSTAPPNKASLDCEQLGRDQYCIRGVAQFR